MTSSEKCLLCTGRKKNTGRFITRSNSHCVSAAQPIVGLSGRPGLQKIKLLGTPYDLEGDKHAVGTSWLDMMLCSFLFIHVSKTTKTSGNYNQHRYPHMYACKSKESI